LARPFSLRRPACLSAPRAAATAGTASPDLRIANLAAGPRPHGAARAATARAAPRIAPSRDYLTGGGGSGGGGGGGGGGAGVPKRGTPRIHWE